MINAPLLVTSAVHAVAPNTQMRNTDERIFWTIHYIDKWIENNPNIQIVLCDGSNFDFSSLLQHQKYRNIEILFFSNNSYEVSKKGKGYGEGEIISFALDNSKILNESEYFMRSTAKYYVENYQNFLNENDFNLKIYPVFGSFSNLVKFRIQSVDLRFFIVKKSFYIKEMLNIHENTNELDANRTSLEGVYGKFARDYENLIDFISEPFRVSYFSGSLNEKIIANDNKFLNLLRFLIRFFLFRVNFFRKCFK